MTSSVLRLALLALLVSACSDDDGGATGTGCTHSTDCPYVSCVCEDDTKGGGSICSMYVCTPAQSFCDQMYCSKHGGTKSATETPRQSVVGSAECNAFCARITALQCPSGPVACNQEFWCEVHQGSCPEAARAELQCKADTATFKCEDKGWSSSSSCSSFQELCPQPDSGTSDAASE